MMKWVSRVQSWRMCSSYRHLWKKSLGEKVLEKFCRLECRHEATQTKVAVCRLIERCNTQSKLCVKGRFDSDYIIMKEDFIQVIN